MIVLFGPVIVVLFVAWPLVVFNRLVKLRAQADAAWADIDVQLKRRHDLIPNLVETVKGYAAHESTTFETVTEARERALDPGGPESRGEAEGALGQALRGLFAVAENYPQLRAAENFAQLQTEISHVEDQIQLSRRYYNAVVSDLNVRIAQFPSNLVAGLGGFQTREFFAAGSDERGSPEVSFGSRSS
jgi:LemA protein